ncbi:Gldg family protein [Coleofasciculus sp. FACHB-1120]|uniref:GldG family protein n=1 Tax=Coleofasciculus sp. FACHB-1120 TaxID=2692783 RepID=UPI001687B79A|nr:Gldg family protein [Coleofasciculus sp. FACHB-1120]MBD2741455.1 Gldg family protein [Coleofasciculus sp. FACHB-1120]
MKTINWKYLKYLFLLGPALTSMGLVAGLVSSSWGAVPVGLIVAGIVIIGLWLLSLGGSPNGFWGRRSTQAGTNALAATLAVVVILGLINFLGVRRVVRVDLTENQLFTLAPQSQQLVQNLSQPVKLWVFEENPNPQDQQLLENYRRYGSQFSFEFVDPQLRPGLAQRFNLQSLGEVYLESEGRRKLIQTVNPQRGESLSETVLTNAIAEITSDRVGKVYFLQGHGERPLQAAQGSISQAVSSLGEKSYTTQPLDLAKTPGIPQDADLIVIAGPKRALFAAEVTALSDYLKRGGRLLVMVDRNTNPGLDNLLKDWGVRLDNRLAIDLSGGQAGLSPAVIMVTRYGQHPITKDFQDGRSFYPFARPIEVTPIAGIQATPLLVTNDQSWAESNPESDRLQFDPASDRQGPLILGVALSRVYPPQSASAPSPTPTPTPTATPGATASPSASPTPTATTSASPSPSATASPSPSPSPTPTATTSASPSSTPGTSASPSASPTPTSTNSPAKTANADQKPAESRLVVLGNSDFASDGLFEQQLNGDVFLNSVSWLSKQDEQLLSIRPKEVKDRRINLSQDQANLLGWIAVLIMPLIGFITAGLVWWFRR